MEEQYGECKDRNQCSKRADNICEQQGQKGRDIFWIGHFEK